MEYRYYTIGTKLHTKIASRHVSRSVKSKNFPIFRPCVGKFFDPRNDFSQIFLIFRKTDLFFRIVNSRRKSSRFDTRIYLRRRPRTTEHSHTHMKTSPIIILTPMQNTLKNTAFPSCLYDVCKCAFVIKKKKKIDPPPNFFFFWGRIFWV